MTVLAPAKLNLCLYLGPRRADGLHELCSLFASLELADELTIDPAADDARAIRAYEKVGFRTVGIMREYWRSPDGAWRDGILMDLLARELDRA
jgi:4-diphosphocytidyl-2C-methyl-D-erythritol kinase